MKKLILLSLLVMATGCSMDASLEQLAAIAPIKFQDPAKTTGLVSGSTQTGTASGGGVTYRVQSTVGIGTTAPSYTLHVVGTAGLSTGTAWTNASDARLKDIHGDYEYGLSEVLQLHTVRYNYKKDNPLGLPSDFSKTGFIAQEVQKVIPDAVNVRKDGYLELNVDPIHWAVVNAIKDLYGKYVAPLMANDKKQDREIAEQKREIASVESNVESLKKENAELKAKDASKDKKISELEARLNRLEKALNSK